MYQVVKGESAVCLTLGWGYIQSCSKITRVKVEDILSPQIYHPVLVAIRLNIFDRQSWLYHTSNISTNDATKM